MVVKLLYIALFSLLFSGCLVKDEKSISVKSPKVIEKNKKIDSKIKNEFQKKQQKCKKYKKIMNYAVSYVVTEFEKGYFDQKDIIGAKAQLFLIQNQSASFFAQNMNDAEKSYNKYYQLSKEEKCDFGKLLVSPLTQIKHTIRELDVKKSQ